MQAQRKVFACEKTIALGALYDTADKLRWKLLSANSETGILMVTERKAGIPFLIRVCPEANETVEVTVELASGVFSDRDLEEEAAVDLLKTLSQIIEDALAKTGHCTPLKE